MNLGISIPSERFDKFEELVNLVFLIFIILQFIVLQVLDQNREIMCSPVVCIIVEGYLPKSAELVLKQIEITLSEALKIVIALHPEYWLGFLVGREGFEPSISAV